MSTVEFTLDKINDINIETTYASKTLSVWIDRSVVIDSIEPGEFLEHHGAVDILALTDDDELYKELMTRRPTIDEIVLGLDINMEDLKDYVLGEDY